MGSTMSTNSNIITKTWHPDLKTSTSSPTSKTHITSTDTFQNPPPSQNITDNPHKDTYLIKRKATTPAYQTSSQNTRKQQANPYTDFMKQNTPSTNMTKSLTTQPTTTTQLKGNSLNNTTMDQGNYCTIHQYSLSKSTTSMKKLTKEC